MSDAISFVFGLAMFAGICWLCIHAGLMQRGEVDRNEDGAESERDVARIVEASRPAPLEVERRHVKAGTAWGQEQ